MPLWKVTPGIYMGRTKLGVELLVSLSRGLPNGG
jgi:hypothetical protein